MASQTKLNSLVGHAFSQRDKLKRESEEWAQVAEQLLNLYLTIEAEQEEDDDYIASRYRDQDDDGRC